MSAQTGKSAERPIRRFEVPVIVGAGPAGMSVGYALTRAGVRPKLLDRGTNVGETWLGYYDSLRLNSPRVVSSLPGMVIDRGAGRFPSRIDMLLYFERYARRWDLDIEFDVDVRRVERDGDGWLLHTSQGPIRAPHVVIATGVFSQPYIPPWPGRATYTRELLHTRDFRNAEPYVGKSVLVVGGGQSSADIAMECVATGSSKVWLSVRRPPHISPPEVLGISPSTFAFVVKHLPPGADPYVDKFTNFMQRFIRLRYFGDVSRYGFTIPEEGLATTVRKTGHGTLIDRGLMAALKAGQIEAVAAVDDLDGDEVVLADGERLRPDVVICGTGARPNLEPLVGHLDLLDHNARPRELGPDAPGLPGLHFIGYRLPGVLPDFRIDAAAIARSITGKRLLFLPRLRRRGEAVYRRGWSPLRTADRRVGEGSDHVAAVRVL
ncbi:flavin-containing monooxygenase [Nocardia sp. NPDC003482]